LAMGMAIVNVALVLVVLLVLKLLPQLSILRRF
jgi:hypothetical protein